MLCVDLVLVLPSAALTPLALLQSNLTGIVVHNGPGSFFEKKIPIANTCAAKRS